MEEIEIGNFIRTKTGKIYKIDKIDKCPICKEKEYINTEIKGDLHFENTYHKKDIVKHSPNIIDLIEVGDIVTIEHKPTCGRSTHIIETKFGLQMFKENLERFKDDKIKSIVTKQQFNQMKYIVGDESSVNKGVD